VAEKKSKDQSAYPKHIAKYQPQAGWLQSLLFLDKMLPLIPVGTSPQVALTITLRISVMICLFASGFHLRLPKSLQQHSRGEVKGPACF
jgi:hypothetical protein